MERVREPEESLIGVVGPGEINARVRVTAVNGIQYRRVDAIDLWKDVAELFGTCVHFVVSETKGPRLIDGTHAFFDKYVRDNPKIVRALAEHWESLLDEMGEGGVIYHIAHSHGALLTTQAAAQVSSYVRSRMIIRTFGALENPYQRDFADIKNIVCAEDPVIRWLNWYEESSNVIRVPGIEKPKKINDNHSMRGEPYWSYLRDCESFDFRQKYETTFSKFKQWVLSFWPFSRNVAT